MNDKLLDELANKTETELKKQAAEVIWLPQLSAVHTNPMYNVSRAKMLWRIAGAEGLSKKLLTNGANGHGQKRMALEAVA